MQHYFASSVEELLLLEVIKDIASFIKQNDTLSFKMENLDFDYLKYRHAAERCDETSPSHKFATEKIIITFVYLLCDSECDFSELFFGQEKTNELKT